MQRLKAAEHTGIIPGHVQCAEKVEGLFHHAGHGLFIRHVGWNRQCSAAIRHNLADYRRQLPAAARICDISATMAGNHLRALENHLGTRLLNRTTRRQRLTEFGQNYYLRSREILRLLSEAEAQAQNLQETPAGLLRVTAPVTFGSEALVPALSQYLERYPDVQLDLALCDRSVDLLEERFDVAIRIGSLPDSGLIARQLSPYRMMICASPDYLAQRGTPVTPEDLSGHECLSFTYSARKFWRLTGQEQMHQVGVNGRLQINNGQALRTAALHGLGIIMQPAVMLSADVTSGRLMQLFTEYELPSRPMHVLYLPQHRSAKLRSFVNYVVAAFG